jgi:hypothetical protein
MSQPVPRCWLLGGWTWARLRATDECRPLHVDIHIRSVQCWGRSDCLAYAVTGLRPLCGIQQAARFQERDLLQPSGGKRGEALLRWVGQESCFSSLNHFSGKTFFRLLSTANRKKVTNRANLSAVLPGCQTKESNENGIPR